MKMFLLGMLTMWVVLSIIFFLLDCFKLELFDYDRAYLRWLFFPIYVFATIVESWEGIVGVIKTLDLSIKYRINPFYTSISEISKKFSEEDKKKFIKRISKNEIEKRKWEKALDI